MADTNNHVVRVVDLEGNTVSTLVLVDDQGLLATGGETRTSGQELWVLEPQIVATGPGEIRLDVRLPGRYKVNEVAPSLLRWQGAEHMVRLAAGEAERIQANPAFPLAFEAEFLPGNGKLAGDAH